MPQQPDAFALLGLPPRAALADGTLQAAWHSAARAAHPDLNTHGDSAPAAELNQALETLKSPVTRLKHLLERHSGAVWRAVPLDAALMSLFEKLGPLLRESAALANQKKAAASALAKALLARGEMRQREALEDLGARIGEAWTAIEEQLPAFDARIAASDPGVWADIQAAQARLAYLDKWRGQIRAQLLELHLA